MHSSNNTVVALSSPIGIGAIGVIRLSGRKSISIAKKIASLSSAEQKIKYRYMYHAYLTDSEEEPIDEVTLCFYKAPNSYTGEDMVEIFCHSGNAVLTAIIDECLKLGARMAEPGEFTKRALMNGKIDLVQAEAIADIIEADSRVSLQAALRQRKGVLSKAVTKWREQIVHLLSETEAEIDFEEEELLDIETNKKRQLQLKEIINELKSAIENAKEGIFVREGINIAITGRPNVGKSSLMNALSRQERSIVTPIPGTTRDVVEQKTIIKGFPAVLRDTAGLRDSEDIIEKEGVSRAKKALEESDVVLVVIDKSRELSKEDINFISQVPLEKSIVVLNKCDLTEKVTKDIAKSFITEVISDRKHKHKKTERKMGQTADIVKNHRAFEIGEKNKQERNQEEKKIIGKEGIDKKFIKIVEVSATEDMGISNLEEAIYRKVVGGDLLKPESLLITNRRHLERIKDAIKHLEEASELFEKKSHPEIIALVLREAADDLLEIIGVITEEEVLNDIFSRFCVGK